MFVTAFVLWLVVTEGLQLTGWLLFATVLLDLVGWAVLENMFNTWVTGERQQHDWNDE